MTNVCQQPGGRAAGDAGGGAPASLLGRDEDELGPRGSGSPRGTAHAGCPEENHGLCGRNFQEPHTQADPGLGAVFGRGAGASAVPLEL